MKNMRAASIVTADAAEMHMTHRFSFRPLGETVSFQYISFQWRRLISCDCFHSSFQVPSTKSSCQSREGAGVQGCGGSYGVFAQANELHHRFYHRLAFVQKLKYASNSFKKQNNLQVNYGFFLSCAVFFFLGSFESEKDRMSSSW